MKAEIVHKNIAVSSTYLSVLFDSFRMALYDCMTFKMEHVVA